MTDTSIEASSRGFGGEYWSRSTTSYNEIYNMEVTKSGIHFEQYGLSGSTVRCLAQ